MKGLIKRVDPLEIIRSASSASERFLIDNFMDVITRVYQYEIFKPMMDLVASKAYEKKLYFKIIPKEMFHLDEGNCLTIEGGVFNKLLNKFVAKKEYTITIRKITPDVIIHEIGHMVEKEAEIELGEGFKKAIISDIKGRNFGNLSLGAAINSVLVNEVKGYPVEQMGSELFTRYFQLLAMAKEVSGKAADYAYNLAEMYKAFPATELWMFDNLYKKLMPKFNTDIVEASKQYIKPIDEIEHKWSDEKIKSVHPDKENKRWIKSIKSIKE